MKPNSYDKDNQRWRCAKRPCVVMLFATIMFSFLCSGCGSSRALTTLKLGREGTLFRGGVKFGIERIDWAVDNETESPTSKKLNAIAVDAYPGLFSNDTDAWPVELRVKNKSKWDYDFSLGTALTGFMVPFPARKSVQHDVEVVVEGLESNTVSFTIKETLWVAFSPLGCIPVPGPSHARNNMMNLYTNPILELTYESVVEAVAQELKRLDASLESSDLEAFKRLAAGHKNSVVSQHAANILSNLSIDEQLISHVNQKAIEMGYNPILVYTDEDGELFVLEGELPGIYDKELGLREKDMVINVGINPCDIIDEVLHKGYYLILKDGAVHIGAIEGYPPVQSSPAASGEKE